MRTASQTTFAERVVRTEAKIHVPFLNAACPPNVGGNVMVQECQPWLKGCLPCSTRTCCVQID